MTSIGIDIGAFSLKLVEVKFSPTLGYEIVNLEIFPLSQGSKLKDRNLEIIEILRPWILNKYDSEQDFFVVSLQQNRFFHRKIGFPFQQRYKILKVLPLTLEDDIPFLQEDLVYDIKLTHYVDSGAEGIAVVSPKKPLQQLLQFTKQFHVNPDIVSAQEFALWNLFFNEKRGIPHTKKDQETKNTNEEQLKELSERASPETESLTSENAQEDLLKKEEKQTSQNFAQISLNIGHKKTLILIFENNLLVDFKSLDWGGESIIKKRAEDSSMSYYEILKEFQEEQESQLKGENYSEDIKNPSLHKSIKSSVLKFSDPFYKWIMEVKGKHELNYRNIFLSGGGALIPYMDSLITECVGLPTQNMNEEVFSDHSVSSDILSKMNKTAKMSCAVALGLALEGLKKSRSPALNLLKGEFAKKSYKLENFMKKWATLLQTSAALFILFFIYSSFRSNFTSSISEKGEELMKAKAFKVTSLKSSQATPLGINKFLKTQNKQKKSTKLIDKIFKTPSPLDILKKLSQSFPKRKELPVKILTLNLSHEILYLEVSTSDQKTVQNLETTLKSFAKDKKVKVKVLEKKPKKKKEESSTDQEALLNSKSQPNQEEDPSSKNLLFSMEVKLKEWSKI